MSRPILRGAFTALLTVLVFGASIGFAPPAHAETQVFTDPYGDAGNDYADIVGFGATYNQTAIAVSARPESMASLFSGEGLIWGIDTNGNNAEDYEVYLTEFGAEVHVAASSGVGAKVCDADASDDTSFVVAFLASCIGTPPSIRIKVFSYILGDGDFAPNTGFSAVINRDASTAPPPPPPPPPPDPYLTGASSTCKTGPATGTDTSGYWMITEAGEVFCFGNALHYGSERFSGTLKAVDIEPSRTARGYWILTNQGRVWTKGDAPYHGDASLSPGENAVSLSATPSGNGYWIFTDKGRVITRGDAPFKGDMSGTVLNGAVLGSVATPSGLGYFMVASDGGIFTFGDALFAGSTGAMVLNKPVMSMATDPDGHGYWLVASDGGVFAFDAAFHGSMGGTSLSKPISGMVPGTAGYLMVARDGGIFAFGTVAFHGSLGANPPTSPVVSVALRPPT